MIIAEEVKAIFIHIEKTGGRSITKLLAPYVLDCHRLNKVKAVGQKGWGQSNHINPQHSRFGESLPILDRLGIDPNEYFKFAVVRNPYTRLVSIWVNMYARPMDVKSTFINHIRFKFARHTGLKPFPSQEFYQKYSDGCFKNFVYFVDELVATLPPQKLRRYLGATDQYSYLENDRNLEFNYIAKLENLNESIRDINNELNLTKGIEIPHLNQNKENPKKCKDILKFYDRESLNIVNRLFARDFARFNYEKLTTLELPKDINSTKYKANLNTELFVKLK